METTLDLEYRSRAQKHAVSRLQVLKLRSDSSASFDAVFSTGKQFSIVSTEDDYAVRGIDVQETYLSCFTSVI